MAVILLGKATWKEVDELDRNNVVTILPTGSCEQHGLHLPIDTDSFLASEVAIRAAQRADTLTNNLEILMLPVLGIGRSPHHLGFSGTLSLSTSTYIGLVEEICFCLCQHGFTRILILNGHGFNIDYLRAAARNVRDRVDSLIAAASYWTMAKDQIAEIRESAIGGICHAGEMESSCMLFLSEESVRKEYLRDEIAQPISSHIKLDLLDDAGREGVWVNNNISDFSKTGTIGDPGLANSEKGRKFLDSIVNSIAEFIVDFSRWTLENIGKGSDI